jgi:hypothetical protein
LSDPRSQSHQDHAIKEDLVDNPIPYKDADTNNNNNNKEEDTSKIVDKVHNESIINNKKDIEVPKKKPSEMDDDELTKHLGKKKTFRFLVINDDGSYSYEEKRRRSVSQKTLQNLNELGMIAGNFFNINRKMDVDPNSLYTNNLYYEIQGKKFYTQNSLFDYYFRSIIFYSFGIPLEQQDKYAIDDDPEEMDINDAYALRTIAKACIAIGNWGWAYFHRDSKST